MPAICTEETCGWSGPMIQVEYGRCPQCGCKINYDSKPLVGSAITKIEDFNRRAIAALAGLSLGEWEQGFLKAHRLGIERYGTLGLSSQNELFKIVIRHHASIEKPLTDYAANKAKGYA